MGVLKMDATKMLLETSALWAEAKKLREEVQALKKASEEVDNILQRLAKEISLMEPAKKGEE